MKEDDEVKVRGRREGFTAGCHAGRVAGKTALKIIPRGVLA